jgi:hypothetical protein
MSEDVAVYLDLDNVLIGAQEANLTFDINLILEKVEALTHGRIVLRRAYGDWRQRAQLTKEMAAAGFELQSTVRLSNNSKNLADMQMVVDAMSTLIDGHDYGTYVLITGDRDFAPLVQALRKRGKQAIGVGVKHTASQRLVHLCDHFIYYDQLAAAADQLVDEQMADLLQRALDQLLQDAERVPASLLKQRVQSLSKGAFGRSPQGKMIFSRLLGRYPHIVQLDQEGTTLYARRPGSLAPQELTASDGGQQLPESEVKELLEQALDQLLQDQDHVRASILKQRMQDLSNGSFDETLQGDKSYRKFLDRHQDLVAIDQEGSTIYVLRAGSATTSASLPGSKGLTNAEAKSLLESAMADLLVDQNRVRASLLKQRMQELSNGTFDESYLGDDSFRQFLERYPSLVQAQQKGTTLLISRPDNYIEQEELHLLYRSSLKKRGLRVVPSDIRLQVLKDLITLLQHQPELEWRQIVNHLAAYYQRSGQHEISKSYVNDVLRVARRAEVIGVQNGGSLATAAVTLQVNGARVFQEMVIQCDLTYLKELQTLDEPFNLEQASIALYENVGHVRYLKVILNRFSDNGHNTS